MKRVYIWLITITLAGTVLAVIWLQLKWINEALENQEQQFASLVNKILNETVLYLEEKELLFSKTNEIVSASPDSLTAFSFSNNKKIMQFIEDNANSSTTDTQKVIIFQEAPKVSDPDKRFFEVKDQEFINKLRKESSPIYIAEYQNKMTGKKIDFANRIDPQEIKRLLDSAFAANHIDHDYEFALVDNTGKYLFETDKFEKNKAETEIFETQLFPHDKYNTKKISLILYFPDEQQVFFAYLPRLVYSTLGLTMILLLISSIVIMTVFRQKKLSELKTQFVNNVSHELKTPIATIQLATEMLSDPSIPQKNIDQITNIIRKENERMKFNVEKILQTSVVEKGRIKFRKEELNLHDLLEKIIESFSLQLKQKNGLIIKNFNAENPYIYVDETHFTNVIINLLENALKYNENEPVIEIETSNTGNKVILSITDNGIGISKKDQKKIFEQFYRVHRGDVHNYKSFGLGLSYVKKIIDEHNGKITVDSEVGQGTTFTITLPTLDKSDV